VADIEAFDHGSAVDANVKTVGTRVQSTRCGELEARVVAARADRQIHPEIAAVHAVAIQLGICRAADFAGGSIRPPTRRDRIRAVGYPSDQLHAGSPGVSDRIAIILTLRIAENHPL
jgi:hypothetical protein